jgi:hypothetical protein
MTPNEAAELMRRSQTTGAPTSEFDAAGGYAAVKKLAESNTTGFQSGIRTTADMAKYLPNDAVVRFDAKGQGGLGETFYASGNSATGGGPGVNERLDTLSGQYDSLSGQYGLLNTQYGTLNTSFLDLQKQLAAMKAKSTAGTSANSLTGATSVVDSGATNTSGLGGTSSGGLNATSSSGAVYGPDGTAYPSPAAAIAAGVYNYTMFPPTGAGQPQGLVTNAMSSADAAKLSGVTSNYYGGVNTNPDNPWVNLYPTTR